MAPRYMKPGEDFSFDSQFGFTGSATGRHDASNHPADTDDQEYGDGSYAEGLKGRALAKQKMAKGGPVKRALGGPAMPGGGPPGQGMPGAQQASRATITMPVTDAARSARAMTQAGQAVGAAKAVAGLANAARSMRNPGAATAMNARPPQPVAPQGIPPQGGVPQMRNGGHFIQGMHLKKGALHRQLGIPADKPIPTARLQKAAHSSNPLEARRARTAEMLKGLPHARKG